MLAGGLVFVSAIGAATSLAHAHQPELVNPRVAVVESGPRLSRLMNRPVRNDRDQRIGFLADFVVNQDLALFAILQVGSFIGLESRFVAVPFKLLRIDETMRIATLPGATRDALRNYPAFSFRN